MHEIYVNKTSIMRDVVRRVGNGYQLHVAGIVPCQDVVGFADRMAQKHRTNARRKQREYARRKGLASAAFYLHPLANREEFSWLLLLTDGEHASSRNAPRRIDDKTARARFEGRYELLRLPVRGGGATWTWRMTEDVRRGCRERLRVAVRRGDDDALKQALVSIGKMPRERGVRKQVDELYRDARREWKRSRGRADFPFEALRPRGYNGSFQNAAMVPLEGVVERLESGRPPFDRSQH